MSNLKINDLELYQTEDIDSHKVQGGLYNSGYNSGFFTYYLIVNQHPVYLHADVKEISEQELKPTVEGYQLTVSESTGNSFSSATVGRIGNINYATSRSSSRLY